MVNADENENFFSGIGESDFYNAIGIGPGIGTGPGTQKALHDLLMSCNQPMILDADAINILGINNKWLSIIPTGSILTPHPREFERIAGKTNNGYSRLMKQINFSEKYNCIIVLKGAYTSISLPDRKVFFNSTGNPGMATAGSGDVLTGIILSLLAQGYSSENAAIIGVFLHGLAGDVAAEKTCYESMIASDIINNIGNAFKRLRGKTSEPVI
jgi:hydroxyethylthiazole kinase-like uncharacterized protein yjeF